MSNQDTIQPPAAQAEELTDFSQLRRDERVPCDGFAELVAPEQGVLMRGQIRDLSQHGCYVGVRTPVRLRLASQVELRLTLEGSRFSVLANVRALKAGSGVGFEFDLLDARQQSAIDNLISRLTGSENFQETPAGKTAAPKATPTVLR